MAVRNGFIRSNPVDGIRFSDIASKEETNKNAALTEEQQDAFLRFISTNKSYKYLEPLFTFMLGTGCRIGETSGLLWSDCDFEKNVIHIGHNLVIIKNADGPGYSSVMHPPKTASGIRDIPMLDEVRRLLFRIRESEIASGLYNKDGFVFLNNHGDPILRYGAYYSLKRVIRRYNATAPDGAVKLPEFSLHALRHTFCTRMCENVSDDNTLKVIQSVMGHANISTTPNVYTDVQMKQKLFWWYRHSERLG